MEISIEQHKASDVSSVMKGLQCRKESIAYKDAKKLLDTVKSGKWRLDNYCLYMAAVLHLWSDLAFVVVEDSR